MGRQQHVQGSHWKQHCCCHVLGKISVIWALPAGSCVHSITLPSALFALPFPQMQSLPCTKPPPAVSCDWPAPRSPLQPGCSRAGPTGTPDNEHCTEREANSLPRSGLIPPSFPTPNLSMAALCNFTWSIPGSTCSHLQLHLILQQSWFPAPLLKPSYCPAEIFPDPCRGAGDISLRINKVQTMSGPTTWFTLPAQCLAAPHWAIQLLWMF